MRYLPIIAFLTSFSAFSFSEDGVSISVNDIEKPPEVKVIEYIKSLKNNIRNLVDENEKIVKNSNDMKNEIELLNDRINKLKVSNNELINKNTDLQLEVSRYVRDTAAVSSVSSSEINENELKLSFYKSKVLDDNLKKAIDENRDLKNKISDLELELKTTKDLFSYGNTMRDTELDRVKSKAQSYDSANSGVKALNDALVKERQINQQLVNYMTSSGKNVYIVQSK